MLAAEHFRYKEGAPDARAARPFRARGKIAVLRYRAEVAAIVDDIGEPIVPAVASG